MPRDVETLSHIPLFRGLQPGSISDLNGKCSWRRVRARQWIIDYQQEGIDVFFVASGSVRVVIYAKSGREVILGDLHTGGFFGELAAIDGKSRSAGVFALTDAVIAAMPGAIFMETLHAYPSVCDEVLRMLASRLRALDHRVLEYASLKVAQRIYSELIRLARPDAEDPRQGIISPPPIQTEIAGRVSTHREAVAREMKVLEREGLLLRRRGAIVLTDLPGLIARLDKDTAGSD